MKLKSGYKQTDIGPIPIDWDLKQLGQLTEKVGSGITPKGGSRVYKDSGRPFIRSQNVGWGYLDLEDVVFIDDETHLTFAATEICLGDVFLNITGASIGRSATADQWVAGGNVNQHVCIIRANQNKLVPGFLSAFLVSSHGQRQIDSFQTGGNRQGLNFGQVRSICIATPRKTEEQIAIAMALSDADELLEGLYRLIAKKREFKLASMQQLLTGRVRLRGFTGEWRTQKLRDLLTYKRPDNYIVQSTEDVKYGEIPVLTANKSFVLHYTDEEFGVCSDIPVIVFDDFTTDCKYVTFPFKVKSSAIKLLYAKHDRISLRYLYERMKIVHFPLVAHKRFYISDYQNIEFFVPTYDEQVSIVSVLSDMDAEIAALEQRRAKIADLKQAMMQELLTGKTRLVDFQPSDEQTDAASGNAIGHNWAINEAVVIATLVKHFGRENYPLGRKRYTKLSYLLHRHVESETDGYLKKAAGPYNPQTKYGGPEKIAKKNGYITQHKGPKGHSGYIAADNIAEAEGYFEKWYGPEVIQWLEQFRYKRNDDLEVLTTVDMVVLELRASGRSVTVAAVKDVIASHLEWKAKLDRTAFSDANIAAAIKQSDALLGTEIPRDPHA
ncbi:MAG: restriction endonuclease subunit S [Bacteroidota bacterium]|nr:restriction endonuclease subunit S [Bacteroidota bacterium]